MDGSDSVDSVEVISGVNLHLLTISKITCHNLLSMLRPWRSLHTLRAVRVEKFMTIAWLLESIRSLKFETLKEWGKEL